MVDLTRGRLLIADDEEAITKVLERMFSNAGRLCAVAADGAKAENRLIQENLLVTEV
jgi:CheY-like chemotaxis protein